MDVAGDSPLKGQRFTVISVLAHVGRGAHNDVVIVEESVSDSHAKLQRREGVWYVTDVGSTNGTYLGGRRISAEERLAQDADLRFGAVPVVFRAYETEHHTEPRGGTRQMSVDAIKRPPLAAAPASATPAPAAPVAHARPRPAPPPSTPAPRSGVRWWTWAAVLAAIAAAAAFAIRMR
jgi:predicted component of type VI protein secretion system